MDVADLTQKSDEHDFPMAMARESQRLVAQLWYLKYTFKIEILFLVRTPKGESFIICM